MKACCSALGREEGGREGERPEAGSSQANRLAMRMQGHLVWAAIHEVLTVQPQVQTAVLLLDQAGQCWQATPGPEELRLLKGDAVKAHVLYNKAALLHSATGQCCGSCADVFFLWTAQAYW